MANRIILFCPPNVLPLDVIGPMDAFRIAGWHGQSYEIIVCALSDTINIGGNLQLSNLAPYQDISLTADDILFVGGGPIAPILNDDFRAEHKPLYEWIRNAAQCGTTICSVCTGAYLLADTGILDGLDCSPHWKDTDHMQRMYPKINVKKDVLFSESENIFTCAGIASGIDLAIHVISLRHGPKLAFQISRTLVVYLRRSGDYQQESIYLQYHNHLDDLVHKAQTVLIEKLNTPPSLELLAEEVGSSSRNLSRRFRQSVGLSIGEYLKELRLERARSLLEEVGSKVEDVAIACGFNGGRQLRNLYKQRFGRSPRESV